MPRVLLSAILVVLVLVPGLSQAGGKGVPRQPKGTAKPAKIVTKNSTKNGNADTKAQIRALQMQVKALRAERHALVRKTEDNYRTLRKKVRWTEEELSLRRQALLVEEEQLLALTPDATARQAIRDQYNFVRGLLRREIRLDDAVRHKLADQERSLVYAIRANYDNRILSVEKQIASLRVGNGTPPNPGATIKAAKKAAK